ncbi:junctional adhesion molecule-like isoform X2 [Apodemus sylvaticus]|uniref:junctional adhesion molecule-like isoform X2 n=1 Tax=Apodemus sylvaticus TaxID=10129 RepID=UPI0022442277|nr:junctional adhesion molecule-like isoform X2 [Apodemus sylvaticus]
MVPVSVSAATAESMHIWFTLSLIYCAGRSLSVGVGDAVAGDHGALFFLDTIILDWQLERIMLRLLKLVVIPVILAPVGYPQGLPDSTVSPPQLRVHVGESALMGCVVQRKEEKHVDKVDWLFSKDKQAESEYVLYYYSNLSVPTGRFQNRSHLVGDIFRNDGSLLLQDVQMADEGIYTCEIRLKTESMVLKKSVLLHVLPEEPKDLRVRVGDSIQMRCFFQSTEEKWATKVNWMFSSGKHAEEETVLSYDFNMRSENFQSLGRFRNRVHRMGGISRNDGSIMLQTVKESDQGVYTCSFYLGKLESRKTIVLHVIQDESQRSVSPTPRTDETQRGILDGNQLVIIVGIVCATFLLLPVLILIVKKTKWNKSSVSSMASVKNLENKEKTRPEKHVYSSITTWETVERGPGGESEATYMTMHPVWPSPPKTSNLTFSSVRSK